MNEEMSQFLDVFLDEATEQIDLLERDFLKLETAESPELLQGIFRAAHTLKGSSRAMGFTLLGELTHAMEDILDKLRHNELAVTQEMVDALFQALDTLKAMKEEIADNGITYRNTEKETQRLRAVLNTAPSEVQAEVSYSMQPIAASEFELTEAEKLAVHDAAEAGLTVYRLDIDVVSDCLMKSVRALMVLQALDTAGSVLASLPNEEGIENEAFKTTFALLVATGESAQQLKLIASNVSEIAEVRASEYFPVQSENSSTPAATVPNTASVIAPEISNDSSISQQTTDILATEVPVKTPASASIVPDNQAVVAPMPKKPAPPAQTIRVDVTRLDNLLNLVGELVIDRTRIAQLGIQFEQRYASNEMVEALNETAAHIGRITDELQEQIMKARMLPIDTVFTRFPRMIRDLAQSLDKEVEFVIEGGETEVDRSVIEVIGDPLTHMLRNSVDHGIEQPQDRIAAGKQPQGTVYLSAHHEESHIVIEVRDDGRGIDPNRLRKIAVGKGMMTEEAAAHLTDKEAVNLIFTPGFTTAQAISDVSGRGVGMDIVRNNLQKLGALIELNSVVGKETVFTVKLPLTLAIIRGLLVKVGGGVYALPLGAVVETIKIADCDIHRVNHRETIVQRGRVLPIIRLQHLFSTHDAVTFQQSTVATPKVSPHSAEDKPDGQLKTSQQPHYLVVVGVGMKQVGLMVDSLVGEQEVVIKSLGRYLGEVRGISGATILGNGSVALIVDINSLITIATEEKETRYAA